MVYNTFLSLIFLLFIIATSWSLGRIIQVKLFFYPSNWYYTILVGFFTYLAINLFFCFVFTASHQMVEILFYFLIALHVILFIFILVNYRCFIHKYQIKASCYYFVSIVSFVFLVTYFSSWSFSFNTDPHFHFSYILYLTHLNNLLGIYYDPYTNANAQSYIYVVESFYVLIAMYLIAFNLQLMFFISFALTFLFIVIFALILYLWAHYLFRIKSWNIKYTHALVGSCLLLFTAGFTLFGYTPGEGSCWRLIFILFLIYLLVLLTFNQKNTNFLIYFISITSYVTFCFAISSFYLELFLFLSYFFATFLQKRKLNIFASLFLVGIIGFEFAMIILFYASLLIALLLIFVLLFLYGLLIFLYIKDRILFRTLQAISQKYCWHYLGISFIFLIILNFILFYLSLNKDTLSLFSDSSVNQFFAHWNFLQTVNSSSYGNQSQVVVILITIAIIIGLVLEYGFTFGFFAYNVKKKALFKDNLTCFLLVLTTVILVLFYNPLTTWIIYYNITFDSYHAVQNLIVPLWILTLLSSLVGRINQKKHNASSFTYKKNLTRTFSSLCASLLIIFAGLLSWNFTNVISNNELNSKTSFYTKAPQGEQEIFEKLAKTNPIKTYLILGDCQDYYYFSYLAKTPYTKSDLTEKKPNKAYNAYLAFFETNLQSKTTDQLSKLGTQARDLQVKYIIKQTQNCPANQIGIGSYSYKANLSNQYFCVYETS